MLSSDGTGFRCNFFYNWKTKIPSYVVCGVWCVMCGVWCVVCGEWCVSVVPLCHTQKSTCHTGTCHTINQKSETNGSRSTLCDDHTYVFLKMVEPRFQPSVYRNLWLVVWIKCNSHTHRRHTYTHPPFIILRTHG